MKGSSIYNDVSTFGAITSDIKAIMGTIFGIIMIIIGIALVVHKSKLTKTAQGRVEPITANDLLVCTLSGTDQQQNNLKAVYTCNFKVTFTDPDTGKQYTKTFSNITVELDPGQNPPYDNGKMVDIWYNPTDPSNFSLASDDTSALGWILIVIGVICIIVGWVWAYFANKYKVVGAISGVESGLNLLRSGNI